jgi:hypothetical protein
MINFKASGLTLLIGGQETLGLVDGVAGKGLVGPFPRYSISREDVTTGDGIYLHSKFNINVTGTATIKTTQVEQDVTVKGERQNRIQGEALIAMHMNRQSWPTIGNGLLTISSYGGLDNDITFDNARIISLELPEQNEESSGIQNLEYSFTFEATNESSGKSTNLGVAKKEVKVPTFLLSSVEETWEVTMNEERGAFANNKIEDSYPYRSYSMTHTVSATGSRKMKEQNLDDDGSAWRQASQYVSTRLISDPLSIKDLRTNIVNDKERNVGGEFSPSLMDRYGKSVDDPETEEAEEVAPHAGLGLNLELKEATFNPNSSEKDIQQFKAYNHIRTWSNNQGEGSCSVTETWLISHAAQSVTHDIDISLEVDQSAPANSVTVNGTIQGLSTSPNINKDGDEVKPEDTPSPKDNLAITEDKYVNASGVFSAVIGNAYKAANKVYKETFPKETDKLRTVEINRSVGHNKVTGTITWSVTYDDLEVCIAGAITCDINVTYDNTDAGNELVAIIGVVDNAGGPVIQDMNTTNEQKTSVSIDATMNKASRSTPPTTAAAALATTYKPNGGFRESRSESWNPKSGQYNYSIGWVKTS